MSDVQYLEIDSSYRDRNSWQNPGEFEIPIWQSTNRDKFNALDPISKAGNKITWVSNRFAQILSGSSITVTVLAVATPTGAIADQYVVTVSATAGYLQPFNGYYNGAVGIRTAVVAENRRISSYLYLGKDRGEFIFSSPFPTLLQPGNTIVITDPTNVTDTLFPIFFVPNGINTYANCVLYNNTRNEYRTILTYDSTAKILTVDTFNSAASTQNLGPVTNWTLSDTYSIRETSPTISGSLDGPIDDMNNPSNVNTTSFMLPSGTTGDYTCDFLETEEITIANGGVSSLSAGGTTTIYLNAGTTLESFSIHNYTIRMTSGASSGLTSTITFYQKTDKKCIVFPGFALGTAAADTYCIYYSKQINTAKKIIKYVNEIGTILADTDGAKNYVYFGPTSSNVPGYYNGLGFRVTAGTSTGLKYLISNYTVTNVNGQIIRQANLLRNFSVGAIASGTTYEFTSGIVINPGFSHSICFQKFAILPFLRDNLNSFVNINNSAISRQEIIRYEIELLNIIIPNEVLSVGDGTRITFYPYLYLELSNSTLSNQGNYYIYSNNPFSNKAVFRVPIDDVATAVNSAFLKLDGDGMIQPIAFRYKDNLKLSLKLPSGEVLQTTQLENYSPLPPNRLSQITACFSMKRV